MKTYVVMSEINGETRPLFAGCSINVVMNKIEKLRQFGEKHLYVEVIDYFV